MKCELQRALPSVEGIHPEYLINFLNACEKAESEIHGIMIARHGKVIFEGYNAPYAADIPHIMHSFTKILTNTAVALAYDDGLLKLEDPVLKYFPEYEADANESVLKLKALEAFAKAVAASRILCPGKVVGTNGAYERECRIGLRSGLNVIITGFPKNHHGYMCGYEPGTARRGKFGLPRIMQIMKEEVHNPNVQVPVLKEDLIPLTTAIKIAGRDYIYPKKIGAYTVGDAHWATLINSKMYKNLTLKNDLNDIVNSVNGNSVALLGGRFLSWVIANELDKQVDEIIISDADPWVQRMTVENLQDALDATIIPGDGDVNSAKQADSSIISSTVPGISNKILNKVPNAFNIV